MYNNKVTRFGVVGRIKAQYVSEWSEETMPNWLEAASAYENPNVSYSPNRILK